MDDDIWSNSIQLIMSLLTLSMQIKDISHQIFKFHNCIENVEYKLTIVDNIKD